MFKKTRYDPENTLSKFWHQVPVDYYQNGVSNNIFREIKRVLIPKGIAIIEMDSGNFLFQIAWY